MCTFGVIGGWRNGVGSLFGVVETVVVGIRGLAFDAAAGDHTASQQTEGSAHPTGVEGEAEGHQTLLVMDTNREPHCGYNPTHGCKDIRDNLKYMFIACKIAQQLNGV